MDFSCATEVQVSLTLWSLCWKISIEKIWLFLNMAFVLSNTVLCWIVFNMFHFTDTFIFVCSWYLLKLARIIIEVTNRERHWKFFLWNENCDMIFIVGAITLWFSYIQFCHFFQFNIPNRVQLIDLKLSSSLLFLYALYVVFKDNFQVVFEY